MATFKVENLFYLDSRQSTFIIGQIIEGSISIGMSFQIEGEAVIIDGIEDLYGEKDNKVFSQIALQIHSDRSFCEAMIEKSIVGHELNLVPTRI
jgi:hypothetical protein